MTFLLKIVILLSIMHSALGLHYPQYFQLFKLKNCIGQSNNFLETADNMNSNPDYSTAKSMVHRGLWKVIHLDGVINTTQFLHNYRLCSDVRKNVPIKSVVRVVSGDLDDSVLNLYSSNGFSGEVKTVDKSEVRFDKAFQVGSWAFTGAQHFTLYEEDNFTGSSTCLCSEDLTISYGWGLASNMVVVLNVTVHSVKIGCDPKAAKKIKGNMMDGNEIMTFETKDGDVKTIAGK